MNGEAETLTTLFEDELERLHLRKEIDDFKYLDSLLKAIPEKYHNRIVIHNCYGLQRLYNLYGIHLKSNKRSEYAKLKQAYHIVSTSCHSIDEVKEHKKKYDYVFLSPIFNSISKTEYNSKFDLQLLANEKEIDEKVIALGGINENNISAVYKMGFGGAAVLGAIWK